MRYVRSNKAEKLYLETDKHISAWELKEKEYQDKLKDKQKKKNKKKRSKVKVIKKGKG